MSREFVRKKAGLSTAFILKSQILSVERICEQRVGLSTTFILKSQIAKVPSYCSQRVTKNSEGAQVIKFKIK